MNKKELAKIAVIFRGLSDPGRLNLMLLLESGEKNVSELVSLSNEKVVNVSARLRELYYAKLVTRRREGRQIFYSLADSHITHIINNARNHGTECETQETP